MKAKVKKVKYGGEQVEIKPSLFGAECPANGKEKNIDMQCDECDYYLECFPNIREMFFNNNK